MSRISNFFSHPAIGVLGSIASILGFGLAFYFYNVPQATRGLTCQVDTATTQIVKAGQSSDLTVSYRGQPITTDVTAAQIVLWNAGKQSIRKGDILKTVALVTHGGVPILEASILATSRDVVGASLDTKDVTKGRLAIDWTILEHNDGLRVQLMLAGGVTTRLDVEGVIEGQSTIPVQKLQDNSWIYQISAMVLVIIMLAIFNKATDRLADKYPKFLESFRKRPWILITLFILTLTIFLGIAIYGVYALRVVTAQPAPPMHLLSPSVVSTSPAPKATP